MYTNTKLYRTSQSFGRRTKRTRMQQQFKIQIAEDIELIMNDWRHLDNHLRKREYAFNFWILSKIYNQEEHTIPGLICEYKDKGVDCYVHFPESKELF